MYSARGVVEITEAKWQTQRYRHTRGDFIQKSHSHAQVRLEPVRGYSEPLYATGDVWLPIEKKSELDAVSLQERQSYLRCFKCLLALGVQH